MAAVAGRTVMTMKGAMLAAVLEKDLVSGECCCRVIIGAGNLWFISGSYVTSLAGRKMINGEENLIISLISGSK